MRTLRTTRCGRSSRSRAIKSCSSRTGSDCIPPSHPCCRSGISASSPCCRAWAIPIPTSRTSARSRSGTRLRRATSTSRMDGLRAAPTPRAFAADGVIVGSPDLGPLAGGGTRAIALANTEQFLRQSRLAVAEGQSHNKALQHILKVEADIVQAASELNADHAFTTEFPQGAFGNAVKCACQVIANKAGVAVVRVTLTGFDTHSGQLATQTRLLGELAAGIVALRSALDELSRWKDTLVVTYAEFGRRPKENLSNGTDHGTASVHFALGGRVVGGFYGEQAALDRLSGDGNPAYAIDFRSVYATVLDRLWSVPSAGPLGGRCPTLPLLRA